MRNCIIGPDAPPLPSLLRPSSAGHTQLQDMLCACQHSRAAYGFPMHAGFFESKKALVCLFTLQERGLAHHC